jgi:hypothetical protein
MQTENKQHSSENNSPGLTTPLRNLPDEGPRESKKNERAEMEDGTNLNFYERPIYRAKKYLLF